MGIKLIWDYSYLFGTATFANNATLLAHIVSLAEKAFNFKTVGTLSVSFTLQPIPKSITSKARPNGGNVLGLDPDDGNLFCRCSTCVK